MEPLAEPAIAPLMKTSALHPRTVSKIYYNWMENITRLVHLPPAVVGAPHPRVVLRRLRRDHRVRKTTPRTARTATAKIVRQDEDVLDTWFSSALWPFSHARLPRQDGRFQLLLSDRRALLRVRHHLLLGRPHDLFGHRTHGQSPVPRRAAARHRARRAGAKDVASRSATASTRWRSSTNTARTRCGSR